MPTLQIGDHKVQVGDEFLSLSPEQQNATVDHIAGQLGVKGGPQPRDAATVQAEYNAQPWYKQAAQAADDIVRKTANGLTFGYADKLAGYMNGTGAEAERAKSAEAGSRAGLAGDAAELAGGLATGLGAARNGLTLAKAVPSSLTGLTGLGARTAAMAAEGAGYGALNAAGHDEDLTKGAAFGAVAGGAGNVLGEALSAGVGKVAGAFNKQPKLPSVDDLRAAKDAAYKAADDAGVVLTPSVIQRAKEDAVTKLTDMGYHPQLQPKIGTVLDELDRLSGQNTTLQGYDVARRIASGAYVPGDKANNAMVSKIINSLDDSLAKAGPSDVLMGDASGVQALQEARRLNSIVSKSDRLSEALDKADRQASRAGSGGNIDNAIRQKIDAILNSPSKSRGFSPDELSAMRDVVKGTPSQNVARRLGKLSPNGNGLTLMMHLAGTAAAPGVSIPAAAVGTLAKALADKATPANVAAVDRIVRAGGKRSDAFAAPNSLQRLAETKREALVRALMTGGITATSGQ